MENTGKSKAEKFWDRTAKSYDREESGDAKILEQVVEKTMGLLSPQHTVLDLGCGTGTATNQLATHVKHIDGIDISSKMIEIAKTKAEKLNITNINYRQATLDDSALQPESYDVITCFYILHLLDKPEEAIRRISTLLKPDGLLISATPCMGEKPVQAFFFSLLGKFNMLPSIGLFKHQDLEALITNGGFNLTTSERLNNTSNQYFIVAGR